MARKRVVTPTALTPAPEVKPIPDPVSVSPPKTEVKAEAKRESDANTSNELVVQKVSVPFTFRGETTIKDYLRIFVRPDELQDEPDASWEDHEPEDEAALKQLFATYGKGSGTTISVRLNVDAKGSEEFFLGVRHPKPEGDDDEKLPSVLVDPNSSIGDIALDLFYEMSGDDPPDEFKTRTQLEEEAEEYSPLEDDKATIEALLDEFDMPGDMPAHLYDLPTRLRSILRKTKGLGR